MAKCEMKSMKTSFKSHQFFLLIFIVVFLFLGAGKFFDHKITHPSPTGYMASDAFTHNWLAQNTYDTNYLNELPPYTFENEQQYLEKRNERKVYHPAILPIITASISRLTNFAVYDINIIVVLLLVTLSIILNYAILSQFNSLLAVFSLPLTLLFLQRKFAISLSWGWWDFITAEFFLLAIILIFTLKPFKQRYLMGGILITVAFMSHGVEAGYAALFVAFLFLYVLLFQRKKTIGFLTEQIKTAIVVVIASAYAVLIFLKTWGEIGGSQIYAMSYQDFITNHNLNYFIHFAEFIDFRAIIVIGLLILGGLLWKSKSRVIGYYLFVIFMSLTPYLYFTAGERGFQWRFFWPIYLSMAFGSVVYLVYLFLKSQYKNSMFIKPALFLGCLGIVVFIVYPLPFNGPGVIDPASYEAYNWVQNNVGQHDDVLIMPSLTNNQISSLYLLKRDLFVGRPETSQKMSVDNPNLLLLQNPGMESIYFCLQEDCNPFGTSQFAENSLKQNRPYENRSVCSFNYIYVSLRNNQEMGSKNIAYIQNLINKNITSPVFNNQVVVITKNIVNQNECETKFNS